MEEAYQRRSRLIWLQERGEFQGLVVQHSSVEQALPDAMRPSDTGGRRGRREKWRTGRRQSTMWRRTRALEKARGRKQSSAHRERPIAGPQFERPASRLAPPQWGSSPHSIDMANSLRGKSPTSIHLGLKQEHEKFKKPFRGKWECVEKRISMRSPNVFSSKVVCNSITRGATYCSAITHK